MKAQITTTTAALCGMLLISCTANRPANVLTVGSEYSAMNEQCPDDTGPDTVTIGNHKPTRGPTVHWLCSQGKAMVTAITTPANNCPGYQNPACKVNWMNISAGQSEHSVVTQLGTPDRIAEFQGGWVNWYFDVVGGSIRFQDGVVKSYIKPGENTYHYLGEMAPAATKP